ncbi:hypothetical protein BRC19_02980 [Candidatus Saccharibacteria bacterium QS_5_54_17]|nr:MAG: hypothetical protein BRC19_02980 [Candidatus Saccharibacteria bacterium QS_5_54_17]
MSLPSGLIRVVWWLRRLLDIAICRRRLGRRPGCLGIAAFGNRLRDGRLPGVGKLPHVRRLQLKFRGLGLLVWLAVYPDRWLLVRAIINVLPGVRWLIGRRLVRFPRGRGRLVANLSRRVL